MGRGKDGVGPTKGAASVCRRLPLRSCGKEGYWVPKEEVDEVLSRAYRGEPFRVRVLLLKFNVDRGK